MFEQMIKNAECRVERGEEEISKAKLEQQTLRILRDDWPSSYFPYSYSVQRDGVMRLFFEAPTEAIAREICDQFRPVDLYFNEHNPERFVPRFYWPSHVPEHWKIIEPVVYKIDTWDAAQHHYLLCYAMVQGVRCRVRVQIQSPCRKWHLDYTRTKEGRMFVTYKNARVLADHSNRHHTVEEDTPNLGVWMPPHSTTPPVAYIYTLRSH